MAEWLGSTLSEVNCISLDLPAFGIAAAGALVAVFDADQRGLAAFGALPQQQLGGGAGHGGRRWALGAERHHLRLDRAIGAAVLWRQKADFDHVALDDVADRRQERW